MKFREKHFSVKKLIGKYQILKPKGDNVPLPAFRRSRRKLEKSWNTAKNLTCRAQFFTSFEFYTPIVELGTRTTATWKTANVPTGQ